jgi:DNA-directed RNA polymerase subunit N (RpoN/RPB10)
MPTNNIGMADVYKKLSIILSGCNNISDAHDISDRFVDKYPQYKKMITSVINGKKYDNTMSLKSIHGTISDISLLKYAEEVYSLVNNISEGKILSSSQKRTFRRLEKTKDIKPYTSDLTSNNGTAHKFCPHCKYKQYASNTTNYIICGYDDNGNGRDLEGCGRDWCFKCGKMLCKKWDDDELYVKIHRVHDSRCCKRYAQYIDKDYEKNFCHCSNYNVNRNEMVDDLGLSYNISSNASSGNRSGAKSSETIAS